MTKRKPVKKTTGRNTSTSSQTNSHSRTEQTPPRKTGSAGGRDPRRIAVLIVVALVVIMAIVGIVISSRGCTGTHTDDAQAIQGEWSVDGRDMTVVFTDRQIKLPGGTTYDYSVDTKEGTMTFGVGNVTGSGTYRLGTNKDGALTLAVTEVLDGTETVTSYTKVSDNIQAVPTVTATPAEPAPAEEQTTEGDGTATDEGAVEGSGDGNTEAGEETPSESTEEGTTANAEQV